MPTGAPSERIARICYWQNMDPFHGPNYQYIAGVFRLTANEGRPEGQLSDVPGVILHAWSDYNTFEVVRPEAPLWVGDVIKSAPGTAIAIEFLIGGRVGVKPDKTVQIINEGEAAELHGRNWKKMILPHESLLTRMFRGPKPLKIQTRSAMGIKG